MDDPVNHPEPNNLHTDRPLTSTDQGVRHLCVPLCARPSYSPRPHHSSLRLNVSPLIMPPTTAARRAPAAARIAKFGPAPQTIEEALASKEARHWQKAIDVEMESLTDKNVWTPIVTSPGVKPVGCRWLFQRNPTPQGIEYRARVVAKGGHLPSLSQVDDRAPSGPSMPSLFFLLAYACDHQLHITHIRIEDACLTAPLEQPVAVAIPPRQQIPGKNAFLVTKALYGFKCAPAAGLHAIQEGLRDAGLMRIVQNPSMMVDQEATMELEGDAMAIAMTYAGGVVVAGPTGYGQDCLESLHRSGLIATQGPNDLIFGLTVRREPFNLGGGFKLSQPQYIDRLVQRFDSVFLDRYPPSPMPTQHLMTALKSFAGCMTWLANTSHMRLTPQAFELSRKAHPQLTTKEWFDAWELAHSLLQCLKRQVNRNCELCIRHTPIEDAPQLLAAVIHDQDRFRVVVMLRGAAVDWYMREPEADLDEEEVRWCGIAAAVKSLVHWRAVLDDIGPIYVMPVGPDVIYVEAPLPLPHRSKMCLQAQNTVNTMREENIKFRKFLGDDEVGHMWCPICCSQASGDGA